MISESTLQYISRMFCGDIENTYAYKKGPQLVSFFREHYASTDQYGQGFPSRWAYVYNKLVALLNSNEFDSFLNIVLDKHYIMRDLNISEVDAVQKAESLYAEMNRYMEQDQYVIIKSKDRYHLCEQNSDLVLIGEGGFANVYLQKSTQLVIKKLKDDFVTNEGIRSRFKREFNLMKSLQDTYGIINVYSFDESSYFYSMEKAEMTLETYVNENTLDDKTKLKCIQTIIYIMSSVHQRGIIHRDLSPNNIFIINGQIKIGDFGLGKDLNVLTSHRTLDTNAVGQIRYCAPEQFMQLRDGDKRSDVFSIGKIINFVMTGDSSDSHHIFRSVSEKATNPDSSYRYADAQQLSLYFEKCVKYHAKEKSDDEVLAKISKNIFDDNVEDYIYEMDPVKLCAMILKNRELFINSLLRFMKTDDQHAQFIIQSTNTGFKEVCKKFESYDPFATFAYEIIKSNFSFTVNETAATILRYIAKDVNRYFAQHLIEELIQLGVEPMIEDMLQS